MSEQPIVVGVDDSPESWSAVQWAAHEATLRGLDLRILSAAPPDDAGRTERATNLVAEGRSLALSLASELRTETRVVPGDPADALVEAADTAAMLVIGRRARGALADLVLGSVTREVTGRAYGTTVVVRARQEERPGGEIVVGVDGSAPSEDALDVALDEAHVRGARLTVVYAEAGSIPLRPTDLMPSYIPEVEMHEARERLTRWLAPRTGHRPEVTIRHGVMAGEAPAVLPEAAAEAALLVVGARGHGEAGELQLGSVSHSILHHATCPLAIVRRRG